MIRSTLRGYSLFALVLSCWLLSLAGGWVFNDLLAWLAGLFYVAYDTPGCLPLWPGAHGACGLHRPHLIKQSPKHHKH